MTDELPGNRGASIEALFRLYGRSLLEVASLLVGDEAVAQDVVLDAFADLRVRGRFHDSYEALDQLRTSVVRGARKRPPDPDGVLASLRHRQREVFVLRWWLGLPVEEIGDLLRLSPRAVERADAEARRLLPDADELTVALETQASTAQLSYDAMAELQDRIAAAGQRHRRRVGAGVAVGVLVVAAVATTLWATRTPPYASPTGRPVFAAVVPVADLGTFDVGTGRPRGSVTLPGAAAVTSLPGGGWLVSRVGPGCRSILTTVSPDGTFRRLGGPLPDELSALAISPDGRSVAGVASLCHSTRVVGIELVDRRTGRLVRQWSPPADTTTISGLSWAPDSRRLAYTLGSGVAGRGSGFGILDTRDGGGRLDPMQPATRSVVLDGRSCQVLRSLWLGRTGRFSVFAACVDGNQLILLQVRPQLTVVQQGKVLATLPGSALTLGLDASATDDGKHLLVTTDVATFRIDGSRVTRLIDARPSPAW